MGNSIEGYCMHLSLAFDHHGLDDAVKVDALGRSDGGGREAPTPSSALIWSTLMCMYEQEMFGYMLCEVTEHLAFQREGLEILV